MLKFIILLFFPAFLFATAIFSNNGKRIYQSITTTIKSSAKIVYAITNNSQLVTPLSNSKVLAPKERELFLKEQFTSKKELLGAEEVKKENLNIHDEALEFFHSLNNHSKKPINIE